MARTPSTEYLILDIETVPDVERWSRPEPVEGEPAPEPRKFPPTWAHRIVVIGCLWLDHGYRLKRLGVIGDHSMPAGRTSSPAPVGGEAPPTSGSMTRGTLPPEPTADQRERALLEDFSRFVGRARPLLVTYNGRSFDLPVIVMRALCHGVPLAWYYREPGVRYRYSEEGHLDLCDWLAEHGATRSGSLDAIAQLIGLPGKVGIDGSQVEGLYLSGQLAAIQRYCLADVSQTALLFLRFRLLQGQLSHERYRDVTTALIDALAADGRVGEVLAGLDRSRVLAEPPAEPTG